ncbi:MAG TPA: hypothetical protein VMZ28_14440 [Kofleriaceae bacterium]|nr:hypothetical protein [Kofleriaceae bacterium]
MRTLLVATLMLTLVPSCKKDKGAKKKPADPDKTAEVKKKEPPPEPAKPEVVKLDGFQVPESILYDQANDVYLVSNINGEPGKKDDNGVIMRVSPPPDAKIVEAKFIDGAAEKTTLNAPKGMAIWSGTLYVADIDTVRMFDPNTGAPKGEIKLPGATFANDVTAHDGTVYVSDSGFDKNFKPGKGQAIWAIKDGKAKKLASGLELGGPNGLLAKGDDLWVVTASGEIYKLTKDGKRDAVEKMAAGSLDGIIADKDGTLHVSSWDGKTIYTGAPGSWTKNGELTSPADIGYDPKRGLTLVPIFLENRIEIHPTAKAGEGEPAAATPPEGDAKPAEGGDAKPVEEKKPAEEKPATP